MIQIKKTILTLVALLAVTTGAWADDTYTIKFEANGNSKTVENVTLPHTFSCDFSGENGELDQIIKQLYGLSSGFCSTNSPGASGNSNVTAGMNGNNQFITISAPFEGNATVTGPYLDAAGGYIEIDYSLTISCPGYTPAGYTVSLKDGVKDADKWTVKVGEGQAQALPIGGLKGDGSETVTLQYNGRLKVKGVKAKTPATVTTAPTATTGDIAAGSETALVSGGAATGGTMYYKVTTANTKPTSTEGFSATVPTAKTLAAGTFYVWYYVKADDSHTDSEISATAIAVTVKAATITVTWNNNDITFSGSFESFTKDGVTITAGDIDFDDKNFMDDGTFTTTLGNFTKIEVTAGDVDDVSGTGWSGSDTKKTWTGNNSSVPFSGSIWGWGTTKFVFTIVPTN